MGTKIAILGGGISALAAAYEIKRADPQHVFDITIYQMGWRLGGKCASSRNLSQGMDLRNEEHGLHVLGGWYHNTFEMIRNVYADWQALDPADARSFDEAFLPLNGAVLFDQPRRLFGARRKWRKLAITFPDPRGEPGLDVPDLTIQTLARRMLDWVRHLAGGAAAHLPEKLNASTTQSTLAAFDMLLTEFDAGVENDWPEALVKQFTDRIDALSQHFVDAVEGNVESTEKGNKEAADWFDPKPASGLSPGDLLTLLVLAMTISRGIIADRLITKGFDAANGEETMQWLRRHKAPGFVLSSPFVDLGYHYAFSYIDGNPSRPDMAAGAALRGYIRMALGQSGSFFYHFDGGIGDVLIKPLYDVLKANGVRFRFFSEVIHLGLDTDGQHIETVRIRRQANVLAGAEAYEPLFECEDGTRVWPDAPLEDQIGLGEGQTRLPDDFEDPADPGEKAPLETLQADVDFDLAILAIPGTALKDICSDLKARSRRWSNYLDNVFSCPTLSVQVWTKSTPTQLGWPGLPPITTGHVLPLSTWCDMSHHVKFETASDYAGLHFLCGPYQPGTAAPDIVARDWLKANFNDVLGNWRATNPALEPRNLYVRVNAKPSDLYIFSPAGSIAHRLRFDESGYANLILCGDWVRNGTDLGWVEGAVTTARQCSRHIARSPQRIYGETDFG